MKRIWWILFAIGLAWFFFRRPIEQWFAARQSGLQAAADASTLNGYTTYNAQIYSEPFWTPFVNFFKAGTYLPASPGNAQTASSLNYSVQG